MLDFISHPSYNLADSLVSNSSTDQESLRKPRCNSNQNLKDNSMYNNSSHSSAFAPFQGNSGSGGSRNIWGGGGGGGGNSGGSSGGHGNAGGTPHNSNWGANGGSNMGRGGNGRQTAGGWDRPRNGNGFSLAPGVNSRPIGAWGDAGTPAGSSNGASGTAPGSSIYPQTGGTTAASQSKVNPSNIWNIPGVGSEGGAPPNERESAGSVRPIPSATPASNIVATPGSAGASSDPQGDSFTNIGIWEPEDKQGKDMDSDPKGTRLWAMFLQSRGHAEDKNMGGKMKIPSFQSVEEMSDSEKRLLLERLINTHEGWGKISVSQDVPWDETMNTFNRSESISSDKTHSDNPESPTSLSDPTSFPAMSKSAGNNSVSLVSPTSKAGDGWGSPQGTDNMRSAVGGMHRNSSSQMLGGPGDEAGTSAWKQQSSGAPWHSPQGYDAMSQGSHSVAPGGNQFNSQPSQSNQSTQQAITGPVSVSVAPPHPNQQQPGPTGASLPSPNAWDKPLKSPASVIGGAPGSNQLPGGDKNGNGTGGQAGNQSGMGGGASWPLDTAAAAGEIAAAITTVPLPTLPSSSNAVWTSKSTDIGGGDSWDSHSVNRGLSSDMWNLDNSDKGSLISESMRGGNGGGGLHQHSLHSSRVPSPSPLDAVSDELFKANMQNSSNAMSKLPKTLSGQMMGNQQQSSAGLGGASMVASHQRPTNLGPNMSGFPSSDSPGPLDFPISGILDSSDNQMQNSIFGNSASHNPAGKYQQSSFMGGQTGSARTSGAAPGSSMIPGGNTGSMMMQQQQQANALKQQQQQMHHLELACKAGLLPSNTNLRIFSLGLETRQTVHYRDCLQKYAQTKFAYQKLRAQHQFKSNQVQQNPRSQSLQAAYHEHLQSMKSYEHNLLALEQICNKLFMDVQAQAASAMQMHSPQQQSSNNTSASLIGGSGITGLIGSGGNGGSSGSRLNKWIGTPDSGSNPSSASAMEDNVFDMTNPSAFGGMPFGGGYKGGDSGSKIVPSNIPEFIPGHPWTGTKDYANDPDATPASVNTWQSAVNQNDVMTLQESLKAMAVGGGNSQGGMGNFMKSPNWNNQGSSGFDMGGASDMWRGQPRMTPGPGSSSKSWNVGPYGAPGLSGQGSIGGGPSGNSAKWQQGIRGQGMSSTGYQNSFGSQSGMSSQRPNMPHGFGPGGYRSGSSGHGNQNVMGSGWNYPGGNLMGGGGGTSGGSFDTSSLGMMPFGSMGGQSGDHSSGDQGGNGSGAM